VRRGFRSPGISSTANPAGSLIRTVSLYDSESSTMSCRCPEEFRIAARSGDRVYLAYGELAISIGLVLGVLVRAASVCGMVIMLILLFSSNYPGAGVLFPRVCYWGYRGGSVAAAVSEAIGLTGNLR